MIILGIETSCDETAAAVLTNNDKQSLRSNDLKRITILSNVVASSASLQAKYGGVIPEQAAREQIKSIIPVIEESLQASGHRLQDIDAIAVTYGPGLIGSLLVGVETAKTLAVIWNKPLIHINHLLGHFYANWIQNGLSNIVYGIPEKQNNKRLTINDVPIFPCLGLLVSGGHTDLVLFKDHGKYEYLGGTRDDAAGECFDKCARLLGLPYPGGPEIARLAESAKRAKLARAGNPKAFDLPRPMIDSDDFDFSFSGLKTAVANLLHTPKTRYDLAASIEQAIVDVLVTKTIKAVQAYKVSTVIIAGGVAANQKLTKDLRLKIKDLGINAKLYIPSPELCTDNAAMIASAAFFQKPVKDPLSIQAVPNLALVT